MNRWRWHSAYSSANIKKLKKYKIFSNIFYGLLDSSLAVWYVFIPHLMRGGVR